MQDSGSVEFSDMLTLINGLKSSLADKAHRIDNLRRAIIRASGGLASENAMKAELEQRVGEAKWRILQKPAVDAFLEEMLEDAHTRRIAAMERLLTALVMEVMPGENPIKLELTMKSGAPWLDIVSEIAKGVTEDIYEDQGGALTNLLVVGLRMAVIAKSRARRIIFLDESDCWIEDSRVPAFYNMVRQVSKQIGFQCFAISHHDIRQFQGTKEERQAGDGIRVASLYGHPKSAGGVHIDNDKVMYRWRDDEVGLRSIRMKNVQGYEDEIIHLSPGITSLVGPNNHGKSTLVRLARAVFFGEIRDRLVTTGKDVCQAEFVFERGRTLRFTRNNVKSPANLWEMIGPNGLVMEEDGMRYSTPSRSGVPEWVTRIFGIGPIEKLDPQIIKQKEPIFLLNKGGHVRASVLSIGQETGHIQTMMQMHKKRCSEDNSIIKEGEQTMSAILRRIAKLEAVMALDERVSEAETILNEASNAIEEVSKIEHSLSKLSAIRLNLQRLKAQEQMFTQLPDGRYFSEMTDYLRMGERVVKFADKISTEKREINMVKQAKTIISKVENDLPVITATEQVTQAGKAIVALKAQLANLREQRKILDGLVEATPMIVGTKHVEKISQTLSAHRTALEKVRSDLRSAENDRLNCEHEVEQLASEMSNHCPLCKQRVDNALQFLAKEVYA